MRPVVAQGPTAGQPAAQAPVPTAKVSRRAALGTGLAVLAVLPAEVSALTSEQPGRLVLKHKDLAPKVHAHFKKLTSDKDAQKAFVENPTQVMLQEFVPAEHAKNVSPQRISNANRLLYAALANQKFRTWSEEYQQSLFKKKEIDKAEVFKDFSKALALHGSPELMLAILEGVQLGKGKQADDPAAVATTLNTIDTMVILINPVVTAPTNVTVTGFPGEGKEYIIQAAELRALSSQLIARAETLQRSGQLMNIHAIR